MSENGQHFRTDLNEQEEAAELARQKRSARLFGLILLVVVILLLLGTIFGLVRLGVMPFDNSDLFRSA